MIECWLQQRHPKLVIKSRKESMIPLYQGGVGPGKEKGFQKHLFSSYGTRS